MDYSVSSNPARANRNRSSRAECVADKVPIPGFRETAESLPPISAAWSFQLITDIDSLKIYIFIGTVCSKHLAGHWRSLFLFRVHRNTRVCLCITFIQAMAKSKVYTMFRHRLHAMPQQYSVIWQFYANSFANYRRPASVPYSWWLDFTRWRVQDIHLCRLDAHPTKSFPQLHTFAVFCYFCYKRDHPRCLSCTHRLFRMWTAFLLCFCFSVRSTDRSTYTVKRARNSSP